MAKLTSFIDTTAHSSTWTCPAGVTQVTIIGCGGGSSGGTGAAIVNNTGGSSELGGAGGGAAIPGVYVYTVVPGTSYSYTIGAGGATVNATPIIALNTSQIGTKGNDGNDTIFDLIQFRGAGAGATAVTVGYPIRTFSSFTTVGATGGAGSNTAANGTSGSFSWAGNTSYVGIGGTSTAASGIGIGFAGGGGGGGVHGGVISGTKISSGGNGGNGSKAGTIGGTGGVYTYAYAGSSGYYGGGGGGGGAALGVVLSGPVSVAAGSGGAGGNGYLIIQWVV